MGLGLMSGFLGARRSAAIGYRAKGTQYQSPRSTGTEPNPFFLSSPESLERGSERSRYLNTAMPPTERITPRTTSPFRNTLSWPSPSHSRPTPTRRTPNPMPNHLHSRRRFARATGAQDSGPPVIPTRAGAISPCVSLLSTRPPGAYLTDISLFESKRPDAGLGVLLPSASENANAGDVIAAVADYHGDLDFESCYNSGVVRSRLVPASARVIVHAG